jgi:hypothetical protein
MNQLRISAAALAAVFAAGLMVSAQAAEQTASLPYPVAQPRPFGAALQTRSPLSNYDPYTHGAGPCPQGSPDDTVGCRVLMPPSAPIFGAGSQ